MGTNLSTREQKDAVTIGEIRYILMERLESDIATLSKLLRQGYPQLQQAKAYLDGHITEVLTELQNLDNFADRKTFRDLMNKGVNNG